MAVSIILPIIPRLIDVVSVPALALLITIDKSLGIITSPTTSTVIKKGAKTKNAR